MLEKIDFFLRHSLNDLRINGRRTFFALLCIASGVAAIVSLQTLGVMITDSLTSSLQESNCGDIQIDTSAEFDVPAEIAHLGVERGIVESAGSGSTFGPDEGDSLSFTPSGIVLIRDWFSTHFPGSEVTYRRVIAADDHGPPPSSISNPRTGVEQSFVTSHIIDPQAYPLYGKRISEDGQPLNELLQEPTDIVINRRLADTLGVQVDDTLRLNYVNQDLVLRGIVPNESEGGFENLLGSLFGYYYADLSAADLFEGMQPKTDKIFVRLADPSKLRVARTMFAEQFPYLSTITTLDLERQNSQISKTFNQLATLMGLVSLLIGSIGIVNTMQVIVSRRIGEIAVLKTVGLQGEHVTTLFLVEAALMGVFGSLMGIVLGWLTALLLKGIAGTFSAQPSSFQITPGPALTGFAVGIVVTTIFGFLPALAASRVRPKVVLQTNETALPRAGGARALIAILLMLLALGVVTQTLVGDLLAFDIGRWIGRGVVALFGGLMGLAMTAAGIMPGQVRDKRWSHVLWRVLSTVVLAILGGVLGGTIPATAVVLGLFVSIGALYLLLWALIWLVGRFFPTCRFADLKIALRSMISTRRRSAATMLALVIGVLSLSQLTIVARAVAGRFQQALVDDAGGNVIVWVAAGQADTLERVKTRLAGTEGVHSYSIGGVYDVELLSLYDTSEGETVTWDELLQREGVDVGWPLGGDDDELREAVSGIDGREVNSNLPDVPFHKGRQLTAADAGQPHIVVTANAATLAAGFDVGDELTFRLQGNDESAEITLEIVGMIDRTDEMISIGVLSPNYAPLDVFPAHIPPERVGAVVDIDQGQIGALRRALSDTPGVFLIEAHYLNDVINRATAQFATFPILIAALALFTGVVVIANSVALSTRERRCEIGIMKAIGLQRERALAMLLLEHGLMGTISGLIGVGISGGTSLVVLRMLFGEGSSSVFPYLTALGLMTLCVIVAVLAAVVTGWGASGEKPLNVLRYE